MTGLAARNPYKGKNQERFRKNENSLSDTDYTDVTDEFV